MSDLMHDDQSFLLSDYKPAVSPLDLPVQVMLAHCRAESPFYLALKKGCTPGTTLSGLFNTAMWQAACRGTQDGHSPCNKGENRGSPVCRDPNSCAVRWLYKPFCPVRKESMPRPVFLRSVELESECETLDFMLKVTFWGRHAIRARCTIEDIVNTMGVLGLSVCGHSIRFRVEDMAYGDVETIDSKCRRYRGHPPSHLALEFPTPYVPPRHAMAQGEFSLTEMLANCAYQTCLWDLVDRDIPGEILAGGARHDLARNARNAARELAAGLQIIRADLAPVSDGERQSASNRHSFPLGGFVGRVEVRGNIQDALPWLIALAMGGGGQRRALGFGAVNLWLGQAIGELNPFSPCLLIRFDL